MSESALEIISIITILGIMLGLTLLRKYLREVKRQTEIQKQKVDELSRRLNINTPTRADRKP